MTTQSILDQENVSFTKFISPFSVNLLWDKELLFNIEKSTPKLAKSEMEVYFPQILWNWGLESAWKMFRGIVPCWHGKGRISHISLMRPKERVLKAEWGQDKSRPYFSIIDVNGVHISRNSRRAQVDFRFKTDLTSTALPGNVSFTRNRMADWQLNYLQDMFWTLRPAGTRAFRNFVKVKGKILTSIEKWFR